MYDHLDYMWVTVVGKNGNEHPFKGEFVFFLFSLLEKNQNKGPFTHTDNNLRYSFSIAWVFTSYKKFLLNYFE